MRAATPQPRHAKARAEIETKYDALGRLGYRLKAPQQLKILVGLVDAIHAFDRQERLVLAQLNSASIRFAKHTMLQLLATNA